MDLLSKQGFVSIAKWILSSLGATVSWASSRSQLSSMQISKEFKLHHNCLQLAGLKTLVYLQGQPLQNSNPPFVINSYMISPSSPSPPQPPPLSSSSQSSLTLSSSPSSCVIEDLIGSENGAYMNHSDEEELLFLGILDRAEPSMMNRHVNKQNRRSAITTRKYPPPIPHLARTENLAGHMPWILTRHYVNGSLIIKEERVEHHQYLEAHRDKGRLVLNLVLLDDTVQCCHTISSDKNHIEENQESNIECDEDEDDIKVVDEETAERGGGDEGYGANLRKCYTYTGRAIADTNLFCNGSTTTHERDGSYFAHAGSAPLAFSMRPMATAVV